MRAIRSVLWIGPGTGLAASGVLDCPRLDVTWVPDVGEALVLPAAGFDAAIVDGDSAQLVAESVERLRRGPQRSPVIVRLPDTESERRESVLAAGAHEVLLICDAEPDDDAQERLLSLVDRFAEEQIWEHRTEAGDAPEPPSALPGMVGKSRAIVEVAELAMRASETTATVLISGETGTGKEIVARAVHESGPRAARPFVAVNCAAFPDSLLESELFGHVRGAFTGADRTKPGLFAEASGGTLFLDEIGETSATLQASLLRALQEREIRPVGSSRTRPVDARVIAATNRSLRDEAARGFFREDLFYRLAVFPIQVPPLRERREDILPLAEHFLALHGKRERKRDCRLSRSAAHLLLAHDWPGNVRELENEIQRALALTEAGALITQKLLSDRVTSIIEPIVRNTKVGDTLKDNMNRIEAWLIRHALESQGGRRAATARKLGVTREGLYKKMKRLNVE